MKAKVKLRTSDQSNKVLGDIQRLAKAQVFVGVPEKNGSRSKSAVITNAQLAFLHTYGVRGINMRRIVKAKMNRGMSFADATAAYIHSHGSPLYSIPPRPIIQPAIEAPGNREKIQHELRRAAEAVVSGDQPGVLRGLNMAGIVAQNLVRAWFTDPRNHWAPNAPSTIRRKKSDRPLIDTGQLRKSMTYVVSADGH